MNECGRFSVAVAVAALLLPLLQTTMLAAAPPSSSTTQDSGRQVLFDHLCDPPGQSRHSHHSSSPSVVVGGGPGQRCLCFTPGTYVYHDASDCPGDSEEVSSQPPLPTLLVVPFTQPMSPSCFDIPDTARAFTRLSDSAERHQQGHGRKSSKIPMSGLFDPCESSSTSSDSGTERVKRQAGPPPPPPPADPPAPPAGGAAPPPPAAGGGGAPPSPLVKTTINDTADEDFSSTGTEIGHELMRNQMNQYIESVISKLTGLAGDGGNVRGTGTHSHKYPVIRLLDYTKQIMQKTCQVVSGDFFDLALNSFVNLQLETYHIKEPYIGYSAYKRIERAMTRCLAQADPHVFVINKDESSGSGGAGGQEPGNGTGTATGGGGAGPASLPAELCDNHMPTATSNQTVINSGTEFEEVKEITIPEYASSILNKEALTIAEPLIETVWKMLVSTHSYCYIFFSDYFNDHHTYTVALLPLFTNAIQSIWLNEDGKGYEMKDGNKLYGGLLGNVNKILGDIDLCVGASRATSPYPWFMNRPLLDKSNVWRRKRDVTADDMGQGGSDDEILIANLGASGLVGQPGVNEALKGAGWASGENHPAPASFPHVCKGGVAREDVCGRT